MFRIEYVIAVTAAVLPLAAQSAPVQMPPAQPPAAQTPPAQIKPSWDYQDAVFSGMIACRPNADSEYCGNVADKFYTVTLNGQDYVLSPGLSDKQYAAAAAAYFSPDGLGLPALIGLNRNVLAKLPVKTPVQMRFHGGGVDVRVLKQTKQGTLIYKASHYDIAEPQPVETPPKKH